MAANKDGYEAGATAAAVLSPPLSSLSANPLSPPPLCCHRKKVKKRLLSLSVLSTPSLLSAVVSPSDRPPNSNRARAQATHTLYTARGVDWDGSWTTFLPSLPLNYTSAWVCFFICLQQLRTVVFMTNITFVCKVSSVLFHY